MANRCAVNDKPVYTISIMTTVTNFIRSTVFMEWNKWLKEQLKTLEVKFDEQIAHVANKTKDIELILKESVETALERSIKTMMDWSEEKEAPWQHYFSYVSLNRACQDIKDGKVSPWLILNTKSGKEMLAKFSDEQLQIVFHVMNPQHWAMRFKRHVADVELVKEVAKESNLWKKTINLKHMVL